MKAFGFLSFGHYDLAASSRSTPGRTMPEAVRRAHGAPPPLRCPLRATSTPPRLPPASTYRS